MSQPFAVFDIDGTIIRWQLYHAIVDNLAGKQLIKPERFAIARAARMDWKMRTAHDAYRTYENQLVDIYDEAILHISYEQYLTAVQEVFDEHKDQTYTYTRNLISELKQKGYTLFAVSGSQVEIVKLLANYYHFDDYAGTYFEVADGRFTGVKKPLLSKDKPVALQMLIDKYDVTTQGSIGIGDSEGDTAMLGMTEQAIAFNPTRELYTTAQTKGWPIVVERKNVIYRLDQQAGSYTLEGSDATSLLA